jgi:hypothetical protein
MIPLWLKELIWPAWAERARRDAGWWKLERVCWYLVMRDESWPIDRGDIAAARIVNRLMKELT